MNFKEELKELWQKQQYSQLKSQVKIVMFSNLKKAVENGNKTLSVKNLGSVDKTILDEEGFAYKCLPGTDVWEITIIDDE